MLNKVILQGRMVADPELKNTPNGVAVATFRIAVGRNYKTNGGQTADFISIVAWRKTAEFISRYFAKGDMILLDGSIQTRQYTDKSCNNRTAFEVIAENVNFCGSKRSESGGNNYSAQPNESAYSNEFAELSADDGELPF